VGASVLPGGVMAPGHWNDDVPRFFKFSWYLVGAFATAMFFIWTLLVGYVYGDAKRRGMRYVLWTLLAIFIPNAIGFILYFIMRDPVMRNCLKCGALVSSKHSFCQSCGAALTNVCPQCRKTVEPGWSHCTNCGAGLKAA
jgi:lipid-A-disaccharide synthase-like uncharacterized protein